MRKFVERAEVVERFGKEIKNVAIFADNLSVEQAKSVAAFMKKAVVEYGISDKVFKKVPNVLHNKLDFYKYGVENVSDDDCKKIEWFNLFVADEVWVFDNGYDNFTRNGRLDYRLRCAGKLVKFLCMSPDSSDWDFYYGYDYVVAGDEDNMECYDYYIVDAIEDAKSDDAVTEPCKHMRAIGSSELSDVENELVIKAMKMAQECGYVSMRAMVRNDKELDKKMNDLLRSTNEVFFGILFSDGCTERELRNFGAKLDFTASDIAGVRTQYAV